MKKTDTTFKKTTAMMAASMMIISLVLTGCGSSGSAQSSAQAETQVEVQTETEETSANTEAATDDAQAGQNTEAAADNTENAQASGTAAALTADDIEITETIENSTDEEHAITADGEEASYNNVAVVKTGEADGDEADFYGANAAIFATNGATLDLSEITVTTDGTHANGVFSCGEGTTVNISDSAAYRPM